MTHLQKKKKKKMIHLFEMFYFADLQQHTQGFNYTN